MDIFFVVSLKTPGAEELMKRMETFYQALKADEKSSDIPNSTKPEGNTQGK